MTSHHITRHTHTQHRHRIDILFCVALFSSTLFIAPAMSHANHSPDHTDDIETSSMVEASSTVETSSMVETADQEDADRIGAAKGCATGAAVGTALAPGIGTIIGCVAMGFWGFFW